MSLNDQVAVISGGLGDIGRAIATELVRRGAHVAVGDLRPPQAATELLESVEALGRRARYDQADVTDAAGVAQWLEAVEADLGVPTIVVANAAVVTLKPIRELSAQEWRTELETNLTGAFHLAQAAALRMIALERRGHLVFLGSWAAHAPQPHIPAYSVAKAGLRMLSRNMALDLAPVGILVNEVAPGFVDAGLSGKAFRDNPGLRESACNTVPLKRLIDPHEVALHVARLCEPDNRNVTGATVLVDGGLSLIPPVVGTGHGDD